MKLTREKVAEAVRQARLRFEVANLTGLDLTGLDLSGLDLSGACFDNTLLRGTICHGTDFSMTLCSKANFSGADLTGANFTGAKMQNVNLSWTLLSGANFIGADLTAAIVIRAEVEAADNLSWPPWPVHSWALLRLASDEGRPTLMQDGTLYVGCWKGTVKEYRRKALGWRRFVPGRSKERALARLCSTYLKETR